MYTLTTYCLLQKHLVYFRNVLNVLASWLNFDTTPPLKSICCFLFHLKNLFMPTSYYNHKKVHPSKKFKREISLSKSAKAQIYLRESIKKVFSKSINSSSLRTDTWQNPCANMRLRPCLLTWTNKGQLAELFLVSVV